MAWRAASLAAQASVVPAAGLVSYPSVQQSPVQCQAPGTQTPPLNPSEKNVAAVLPWTAFGSATLRQVQVIFRHGARTPVTKTTEFWKGQIWDCCGQPYKPAPLEISHKGTGGPRPLSKQNDAQVRTIYDGGCHKGELTILGKLQAFELGKWLRERYCKQLGFLPDKYEEGIISAHTTNMARTVQTLTGVVSALYSDIPSDRPLQVSTAAENEEFMFGNANACPRLKQMFNSTWEHIKSNAEKDEELKRFTEEVTAKSGGAIKGPINVIDMYDAYTSMISHGKQLPAWVDSTMMATIEHLAIKRIKAVLGTGQGDGGTELLHMAMGRLLQELVCNMDACITGGSKERLHLYSGHDTTVLPLLSAFGMDLDHWPPYASHIVLELWECLSNGKTVYYVRAMYNGQEVVWPGLVDGEMCHLDRFKDYVVHRYLEHDPAKDCFVPAATAEQRTPDAVGSQF